MYQEIPQVSGKVFWYEGILLESHCSLVSGNFFICFLPQNFRKELSIISLIGCGLLPKRASVSFTGSWYHSRHQAGHPQQHWCLPPNCSLSLCFWSQANLESKHREQYLDSNPGSAPISCGLLAVLASLSLWLIKGFLKNSNKIQLVMPYTI